MRNGERRRCRRLKTSRERDRRRWRRRCKAWLRSEGRRKGKRWWRGTILHLLPKNRQLTWIQTKCLKVHLGKGRVLAKAPGVVRVGLLGRMLLLLLLQRQLRSILISWAAAWRRWRALRRKGLGVWRHAKERRGWREVGHSRFATERTWALATTKVT